MSFTYLQPFISKTNAKLLTLGASAELSWNWEADDDELSGPLYFNAAKLTRWGKRPVSVGGSVGHALAGPDAAGDWRARVTVSFLFPK